MRVLQVEAAGRDRGRALNVETRDAVERLRLTPITHPALPGELRIEATSGLALFCGRALLCHNYRGTSLIRDIPLLGPCSRPMPMVLGRS